MACSSILLMTLASSEQKKDVHQRLQVVTHYCSSDLLLNMFAMAVRLSFFSTICLQVIVCCVWFRSQPISTQWFQLLCSNAFVFVSPLHSTSPNPLGPTTGHQSFF
jgi:hypothetical protein